MKQFSAHPSSVRTALWMVMAVSIIHLLTLGFAWNHTDSFSLLTINFEYMVPQHTPLYPLILEVFRSLFNDTGVVLICTVILQQVIFLFAAFQFLKSVRYPIEMGAALCFLYPLFLIQNGIYTEALFASFLLLLLSTAYRAYRNGSISIVDQLLFCASILGLTLTRHVGILYAVLPLFVTFTLPSNPRSNKWRIVALQVSFVVLPFIVSPIIKSGFDTMDVPMYGRPGMHVIEKVFKKSPERRSIIMEKWMANAKDEDEVMAQQIISEAKQDEMWYIQRMKIAAHLRNKYPNQDSLRLEHKTEELMNTAFSNMMLTGDAAVFKQCLTSFVMLALTPPSTSFSLTRQDQDSKESDLFEQFHVFRISYQSWLITPIFWLKYLFCTLHAVFSLAMIIAIVYGIFKGALSRFGVFLLFLFFIQLVVHSIFTIVVARYSIHLDLTLFFIFVDLVESHSESGRIKKLLRFSKFQEHQAIQRPPTNSKEMLLQYWNKIKPSGSWKTTLAILFLSYLGWEIYWYNMVGLSFIKWHTHFAFLLLLFMLLRLIVDLLGFGQKAKDNILILFIGLFLTEAILAGIGWTKTHAEKLSNVYVPAENEFNDFKRYYWIDDPHTVKTLHDKEFNYTRTINSNGYSDAEWTVSKKPNEFRILCLGDSFTEGDGAHADSSYVSFLRRKLQTGSCPITVMNAGKCGSDPFFNFVNYRDLLAQFHPDLIIQTISKHDMADDIILRGGMERFGKDYSLSFQKKPSKTLVFLYAVSYTGRIFFNLLGYNELLISTWWHRKELPKVGTATVNLFKEYVALANQNGTQMLIVFLPNKYKIEAQYPSYFLDLMDEITGMHISTCDLRPFYIDHTEDIDAYYWIDNGHHNARGYELMSEGILQSIKNNGLLKTDSTCAGL